MSTESLELGREQYQLGKDAFERGRYRQSIEYLEKATSLVGRDSRLGGEVQIWLVTAYQANGQQPQAIALCQQLDRHPDLKTRKQGRRLLYILQAPQLKSRPEWLTEIPDLDTLNDSGRSRFAASATSTPTPSRPKTYEPQPIDPSQVNTKDNAFTWVALVAIVLTCGVLFWLGH